jgi:cobalt-zinc-cadmium resistance protein CzcA
MGMERFNHLSKLGLIRKRGRRTGKSHLLYQADHHTGTLPIFSFQKVEGKMFSPLAYTLGFALLGALIFTLTLVPVLVNVVLLKRTSRRNTTPSFIS